MHEFALHKVKIHERSIADKEVRTVQDRPADDAKNKHRPHGNLGGLSGLSGPGSIPIRKLPQ